MEQISVNMTPKGIKPVCHSSQYDKGRIIRLNLLDGIQGYTLTGEETLELEVRKPDNNIVTAEVQNTSSNYVLIVTTEQMTACEGDSNCEIRVRLGDTDIGSINFILRVEEDPLKDGIESETEIHNLHTQIEEINAEILPGMVAAEVTRQYDSDNVMFDDVPTENHGDGYTVNSAGLKAYIPKAIDELDDVEINNPQANQAIVYDPVSDKFKNGEVSTVGGLNDLNDVTLEDVADKQELVYDDTDDVFKNKTTRVELTQAEYNQLVADNEVLPDVDYYITDAPSMQGTSADLSYDGTTKSTYTKIEELDSEKANASDVYTKTQVDSLLSGKASKNLIDYYQSKSGSPAVVAGVGGYATVMVIGFAQGVGAIAILLKINNASIASQIDMFTGTAYTGSQVTFTYNYSLSQLSINTTNASNSTFTVIKGGL